MFTNETKQILSEKLNQSHVSQRKQGNMNLSYIEGHHAIREANRAFEFDGWNRETMYNITCQEQQQDGKWRVGYVAKVGITIHNEPHPIIREGTGFGQGIDADLGRAHESAIKEAETDAMKRALMTFGDIFGLALYDKTQANVEKTAPVQQSKADPKPAQSGGETLQWAFSIILASGEFLDAQEVKLWWKPLGNKDVSAIHFAKVITDRGIKGREALDALAKEFLTEGAA